MSLFFTAYKNRTFSGTITFYDADGEESVLTPNDKVRVKIGRPGDTPILDITSDAALAGGSSVTATNPATLRVDEDDTENLTAAIYEIEANVYDDSDAAIKHAQSGVFNLLTSQLGGVS